MTGDCLTVHKSSGGSLYNFKAEVSSGHKFKHHVEHSFAGTKYDKDYSQTTGCFEKNVTMFVCLIFSKPINRFLNIFLLLKTEIHM